jgi:Domain of unknown function (DUF4157)
MPHGGNVHIAVYAFEQFTPNPENEMGLRPTLLRPPGSQGAGVLRPVSLPHAADNRRTDPARIALTQVAAMQLDGESTRPQTPSPQRALAAPGGTDVRRSLAGIPPLAPGELPPTTFAAPSLRLPLQRKLAIGAVNDPLESEADAMADRVMRTASINAPSANSQTPALRRKCSSGGSRDKCKDEEKGTLQRKAAGTVTPTEAPPIVHDVLRTPGHPLDGETRSFMETRFDHDFSQVRIHADSMAAHSAVEVHARAYTVGRDVVFAAGQFAPSTAQGRTLLAHELAHVTQQSSGAAPPILARAHDPHQPGSSRAVALSDLHDLLVKLLKSLKRRTQLSVMGFKTISVGLVEATDENGSVFQTLVYTTSGNWGSTDVETQAAALGIQRLTATPRAEGRGDTGAPGDSEQLLEEATDANDLNLLGAAVSRKPCPDCSEMIADEDIGIVFVDPAKHLPKRERVRKKKPSANLEAARSEIAQAFGPQVVAPGQEATTGLAPQSSLWHALDILNMPELYQALEEADRADRRAPIESKVHLAGGVNINRLLAPMVAIELKKENLREKPDPLKQSVVSSLFTELLAQLEQKERSFLFKQLYPDLKLTTAPKPVPPKTTEQTKSKEQPTKPKEKSPSETAAESNSYVGTMIKVLVAAGVTAAAIEALTDTLLLIAGNIFKDIVLRIVAEGAASRPVREAVKDIVEEGLKEAGPKARVITEAVRHRVAERIGEEVGHLVEEASKSYLR